MPIPSEILAVDRPKNTVVLDSKSNTRKRYVVRVRRKSVCKKGHNPSPRNGKTIGYIINNLYWSREAENQFEEKQKKEKTAEKAKKKMNQVQELCHLEESQH